MQAIHLLNPQAVKNSKYIFSRISHTDAHTAKTKENSYLTDLQAHSAMHIELCIKCTYYSSHTILIIINI